MRTFSSTDQSCMSASMSSRASEAAVADVAEPCPSNSSISALDSCISGTSGEASTSSSLGYIFDRYKTRIHRRALAAAAREKKRIAPFRNAEDEHFSLIGSSDSCYSSITTHNCKYAHR